MIFVQCMGTQQAKKSEKQKYTMKLAPIQHRSCKSVPASVGTSPRPPTGVPPLDPTGGRQSAVPLFKLCRSLCVHMHGPYYTDSSYLPCTPLHSCLIDVVLGVRTTKKYPPIPVLPNTYEYCPYCL